MSWVRRILIIQVLGVLLPLLCQAKKPCEFFLRASTEELLLHPRSTFYVLKRNERFIKLGNEAHLKKFQNELVNIYAYGNTDVALKALTALKALDRHKKLNLLAIRSRLRFLRRDMVIHDPEVDALVANITALFKKSAAEGFEVCFSEIGDEKETRHKGVILIVKENSFSIRSTKKSDENSEYIIGFDQVDFTSVRRI